MTKPLISCIMLTTPARERLRTAALRCLMGQVDAPPFELIWALGTNDVVPMDQAKMTTGIPHTVVRGDWAHVTDKQNAAITAADGEWFTFWDDDDWSAPDRLAKTAAALTAPASIVGPTSIVYHELCTKPRHTARFTTGAHVVDKVAAIHRPLWVKTPLARLPRRDGRPDPGNVGDWIVRRVQEGILTAPATFDYVAMMHKTNTAAIKAFRVDKDGKTVLDGPRDFELLPGGRAAAAAITSEAALVTFEGAVA